MASLHEMKEISVLYADYIGFNKIANIFQPDDMMAFLNRLYGVMEGPLGEHQGTIDKIIGDGILVTFNAFEPVENHREKAVNAALGIVKAVKLLSHEEEQVIELGIGVSSGQACCGPLGTSKFKPDTVIGPVVNRAFMLAEKSCAEKATTLVDSVVFHETISSFEYQQIEEDIFKIHLPLLH